MAIIWNNGPNAGKVLYEGLVLLVSVRTVRVMSDVWDNERYAEVWAGDRTEVVVLEDWGYIAKGGGWTQSSNEAEDGEWVPPTYQGSSGFFRKREEHFAATAEVDANPAIRAEVQAWRELNYLIENTRGRLSDAARVSLHKEVEVINGRKVPHGTGYEVTTRPLAGQFNTSVSLRNLAGQTWNWVNIENLKVVRPERYVEGEVACGICRRTFVSAIEAGMVGGKFPTGHCRDCQLTCVLAGKGNIRMPAGAVHPHHSAFSDLPLLAGTGEGEAFVRALFENPDDTTTWLIFADWLDEEAGQTERADALRVAILGEPKVKTKPIRKKDLKVTSWKELEAARLYGPRMFECIISGFPPTRHYDTVVVRVAFNSINKHTSKPTFVGVQSNDPNDELRYYDNDKKVKGALLRQCKAVLPPLEVAQPA